MDTKHDLMVLALFSYSEYKLFNSRKSSDKESLSASEVKSMKKQAQVLSHLVSVHKFIAKAFEIGCWFLAAALLYLGATIIWELQKVPNLAYLENYRPLNSIQIFDRNDQLVCVVEGAEKRKVISLDKVSPYIQRAVLTAEDHHFYEHSGVNFASIGRAIFANLQAGHVVEGGSTITQQLVKNLFFEDAKRTLPMKLTEAIVSFQLEKKYSKQKLLELYMNEVYFGNGAYGIEQASLAYFNKSAYELTIAESAFLAGIIKSPSYLGSENNRMQAINRQKEVLDKMHEYAFVTNQQYQDALSQKLKFQKAAEKAPVRKFSKYPYFVSYVLEQTHRYFSEGEMQRHGLRIYTTLDQGAQQIAERALAQGIMRAPNGVNQGALVSINVYDGSVIALVGGVGNYLNNQWNCATNPHTAGSAFKPFVYLAGFARRIISPNSIIYDSPVTFTQSDGKPYKPHNFDKKFMGPITVGKAIALSRNICALKVGQSVGISSIIETARDCGIKSQLAPHLSLALGCSAVSPLEMAAAYATFARGGTYIQPYLIRRIENKTGYVLLSFKPRKRQEFSSESIAQLVDCLQDVVKEGTGTQAKLGDRPVAGKTGTADQAKDLWFIGFTPDLATAVWGGNRDNHAIAGSYVTGGTIMARIWHNYNRAYYAKYPTQPGWFAACTRLAIEFEPKQNDYELKSRTVKTQSAPTYNQEQTENYYRQYYRSRSTPTRAYVRSQKGVTDYRWTSH
jgi:penicillin-binding protein 1A